VAAHLRQQDVSGAFAPQNVFATHAPTAAPAPRRWRRWVRPLLLAGFAALTGLLVAFAWRTVQLADGAVLAGLVELIPTLLACAFAYALSKGSALRAALKAHGIHDVRPLAATALFCESVAVAVASFPGGLNGDVYKAARLGAHPSKKVLRGLIHFRVSIWCAVGLTVLGVIFLRPLGFGLVHLFLWSAGMALLAAAATRWLCFVAPLLWALAAVAADGLAACLLLSHLAGGAALDLLGTHLTCHVLGATTQVPFGLGAFDLGYAWQLQGALTAGGIAAFLAMYRLTGPCVTALVGWVLVARRAGRFFFGRSVQASA
jgi:hypothetical protein